MKNTQQLNTQNGVEENQNKETSSQIVERIEVNETPFIIIGNEESGYFVTWGKFKITKKYNTKEEAKEKIYERDYELLMNISSLITHSIIGKEKEEQKIKESL